MVEILEKVFYLVESGQFGLVFVNVFMDIFSEVILLDSFDWVVQNMCVLKKFFIDDEIVCEIVSVLVKVENFVVYVGGGILLVQVSKEFKEFVEYMGLLVVYFLMGKGVLCDDYLLVLGMMGFWGIFFVNQICLNVDYIFVVGICFKEVDCLSWYFGYIFNIGVKGNDIKVIYIDIEFQEIGCNYLMEIGVVVDVKVVLWVLICLVKEMYFNGFVWDVKKVEIVEF